MLHKTRLLTPGPTPIPSRVRLRMAEEMIHHRKDAFKEAMHKLQPQLQQLFGTTTTVLPLASTGTGAMTAAVHGLFAKGEKVLVVNAGKFGERFVLIAQTRGLEVQSIDLEWGSTVNPQQIQEILDKDSSIRGVLIQLSETSTGALHPVQAVAEITRKRDVLLVADGVSAVSISPCPMDAWGIDCLVTGSQKGLMVPTGLSLLAFSERAWKKAESLPQECFYFNLLKEREKIHAKQTLFSTPVSHVLALHESLTMFFEQGDTPEQALEYIYRKQWALTMMVRAGVQALGLKPFIPENFAWGVTSVLMPQGIDATEVIRLAAQNYGVLLAGGQDHLKGRIVRIGHMGWVDFGDMCAGLHAFAESLRQVGGYSASRSYLEEALGAYNAALQVPAGTPLPTIWS